MGAIAPTQKFIKELLHTIPFNRMEPERRSSLLLHAEPFSVNEGACLFPENEVPTDVCIILHGTVCLYAEMLAEEEPVMLEQQGPGACIGWSTALAGVAGMRGVATSAVRGLTLPLQDFLQIARCDPALREAVFNRAWKGEIWRAVLAEMERRTGRIVSAAGIVERIGARCVACEWPEDGQRISEARDHVWVVVGGEGVSPGDRWKGSDGVLWARLIGLPEREFAEALLEKPPTPARISVRRQAMEPVAPRTAPHLKDSAASGMSVPVPRISRPKGRALRVVAIVICLLALAAGATALWASRQHITQRISVTGRLLFTGDIRTLTAGVGGILGEYNLSEGARTQGGMPLAVIRPPLDEDGARSLTHEIARLEKEAAFCEAVLGGTPADIAAASPALTDLAREHARLAVELRVLGAIARTDTSAPELTQAERARVAAHFASVRLALEERQNNTFRDTSTRHDELREAEAALREAQDEANAHVQAFSGASTGDKKSLEQEMRDYKRVLAGLNNSIARQRDTFNRIRREIAAMQSSAETPATVLAEAAPDVTPEIAHTNEAIAAVEEQLKAGATSAKRAIAAAQKKLEQVGLDAAPRQLKAVQPGYILEAAKLTPGETVSADTTLGRIVTRNTWQIECAFPGSDTGRIENGQELAITVADRYATLVYEQFAPAPGSPTRVNLRDSRDEWRDGMAVRVETTLTTGSLLDEWIRNIGLALR